MKRFVCCCILLGAVTVGLVWADSFTWAGLGDDDMWSNCENWDTECTFPDDQTDVATIPTNSGTAWDVELVEEAIDELTIKESVDFTTDTDPVELLLNKLTIVGPSSGEITITFASDATVHVASS